MKSGKLQTADQLHRWLDTVTAEKIITIEYPPPDIWRRLHTEFNVCYAVRRNNSREIVFATDEKYDADFFFGELLATGLSDIHLIHVNHNGQVLNQFDPDEIHGN